MAHLIENTIHILLVMVNVLTELSESSTVNNDNNGKSTFKYVLETYFQI